MKLFARKRNRPLKAVVFGSGPAALFAAQAIYDTGNVALIVARGPKSKLYGSQYLHAPVPGLDCGEARKVDYILRGSVEDYRLKVYGGYADSTLRVSPQTLSPSHEAWDLRAAYDQAWESFKGLIVPTEITKKILDLGQWNHFDLVIWGIPLEPFCELGHRFSSKEIWAQGDAPELGLGCSVTVDPWTVVVNGEPSPRWYRASNIFGHRTVEWPDGVKPPIKGLVKVRKPVANECDCWMNIQGIPVVRVGRYGTWTKSELSHMAYGHVREAIERM